MLFRLARHRPLRMAFVATALAATACSTSSTAPHTSTTSADSSLTVNASSAYAYIALGVPATTVNVSTPSTSTAWDMGFYVTNVTLNGGAAGPGGVSGYCLCHNFASSNAVIESLTAANTLAEFDSVTASNIPAASAFRADSLQPVVSGWYTGTPGPSVTPTPNMTYILRTGTTASNILIAKLEITAIANPAASSPGQVTFEWAAEPSAGADFGVTNTTTIDVSAGPVYFDLFAGQVTTSTGTWTVEFTGYQIRSNGGVSGSGGVIGLAFPGPPDFADINMALLDQIPSNAYTPDLFGGIYALYPWYRYNLTGNDHQIWPTYDVYLIQVGSAVYKVQMTGFYDTSGDPGFVTFRYARIR
jgi:hypothetical protein